MCVFNYKASNRVFFFFPKPENLSNHCFLIHLLPHEKRRKWGRKKKEEAANEKGVPIRTPAAQWSCCFHQVMCGSLSLIFCPRLRPPPLTAPAAYANSPRYQKRSLFQETQGSNGFSLETMPLLCLLSASRHYLWLGRLRKPNLL